MRTIEASTITKTVKDLFLKASFNIGADVQDALQKSHIMEDSPTGRMVLEQLIENNRIAAKESMAICQDTGMAVLFVELGQEVHIAGGAFDAAVNEGVRQAYDEGYLRKSVVSDPLFERKNTGDNTPAVIHLSLVPGSALRLIAAPKGFGSENMSTLHMLTPADGVEGVKRAVLRTVEEAGPNPCPPIVVGVGIGGTVEQAALIAKKATLRTIGEHNQDKRYAELEEQLLQLVNATGIGPAGLGGRTTALAVNVEHLPTHIAGLPVAINIVCHAVRHAEATI